MCGICGFTGNQDPAALRAMADSIIHRGPDAQGFYEGRAISMAMRRLSIIDLSTGDQPIFNEDRTLAIVFNGEIYNYRELRETLLKKGHVFATASDTETILHLYEEYGENCPKYLDGMFAFAIADKRADKLFIARDHMGVKPLYYAETNGRLAFASEMKALLRLPHMPRRIDPRALDLYLSYLYIPAPYSVLEGVRKLPAGHSLSFYPASGKLSVTQYWDLRKLPAQKLSREEEVQSLRDLLKTAVRKNMISDVPVGLFLSGGLDSSVICALAAQETKKLKTFSIGYAAKNEASYNELSDAKLVARRFGTEHTEIVAEPDIVNLLPRIVRHWDEPHANSSALVNFLIAQAAGKQIKAALTGIGGDEIFGGYPRYMGARFIPAYTKLPLFLRRAGAKAAEALYESGTSRDLANWAKRFTRGGTAGNFACYNSWITVADDKLKTGLYSAEFKRRLGDFDPFSAHHDFFYAAQADGILDRVQYLDIKTYLPEDLLTMADKMSMAHSLELRVPLCDRALAEFMYGLPADRRVRPTALKTLMRKAAEPLLPPEIMRKRKQGFMVPLPLWLKNELKDTVEDALSPDTLRRRGYFRPQAVRAILDDHYSGRQGRADLIWALTVLETWHRIYVDDK